MKTTTKILMALVVMLALVGAACAAVLPNQTLETQGIVSQTIVQCNGIVIASSDYGNQNTNQMLDGAPLADSEVYGSSTYSSNMVALNGQTTLVKTQDYNTKDQLINGRNIDVVTDMQFESSTGGFVTGTESIAQFNAGQATKANDSILCPFGDAATTIPPFNEQVIMGSRYDMFYGTVASDAGATTTAETADTASQTQYAIDATGSGMLNTYMSLFAQDARGDGTELVTPETSEYNVLFPATTKTVTTDGHFEYINRCLKWVPGTTTTVTTPEVGVTTVTPAVYTPVTPSAETSYRDSTTVFGQFTLSKIYGYTSGVVG